MTASSKTDTKMGHTPGPFEYRPDRTIVADGLPLARCYAERNEAVNGPLFAAAPEMLAEMRRDHAFALDVIKALDALDLTDLVLHTQAEMRAEALRAAIAKATGAAS